MEFLQEFNQFNNTLLSLCVKGFLKLEVQKINKTASHSIQEKKSFQRQVSALIFFVVYCEFEKPTKELLCNFIYNYLKNVQQRSLVTVSVHKVR